MGLFSVYRNYLVHWRNNGVLRVLRRSKILFCSHLVVVESQQYFKNSNKQIVSLLALILPGNTLLLLFFDITVLNHIHLFSMM